MKPRSRRERMAAQLADLKMPGALEALDEVLAGVDGGGFTTGEAIERLLGAQIELRNGRRLATAMRSSRLPELKTLADFDFSFQPSIRREQIDSLHELGFLERRENVVFLGPPGVGQDASGDQLGGRRRRERAEDLLRDAERSHRLARGGPRGGPAQAAAQDADAPRPAGRG